MTANEPNASAGILANHVSAAETNGDDLRLRLYDSQAREQGARAALDTVTRELGLMRRVARYAMEGTPLRSEARPAGTIPRVAAIAQLIDPIFHFDVCEDRGPFTFIAGWAFHPCPGWNARDAVVTLLLRDGDRVCRIETGKLLRPDVATHFAGQPAIVSGGARGLEGVGFACELIHDSLPERGRWELGLHLACGTMICECATGQRLVR